MRFNSDLNDEPELIVEGSRMHVLEKGVQAEERAWEKGLNLEEKTLERGSFIRTKHSPCSYPSI